MEGEKQIKSFHSRIHRGEPLTYGEWTFTPVARSLQAQLPGSRGGLIWNRPIALELRSAEGEVRILHIHDLTRLLQIVAIILSAAGAVLIWLIFHPRRDNS